MAQAAGRERAPTRGCGRRSSSIGLPQRRPGSDPLPGPAGGGGSGERGPGLLKQARATPPNDPGPGPLRRRRQKAPQCWPLRACVGSCVMPGRGPGPRAPPGRDPVCNSNRVPDGHCHDGLWGQVAVWPSSLVRVAWEPAAPVHCPPWWPRAPTTCCVTRCYGTRQSLR